MTAYSRHAFAEWCRQFNALLANNQPALAPAAPGNAVNYMFDHGVSAYDAVNTYLFDRGYGPTKEQQP